MIVAPNYLNEHMLATLNLLDNLCILLGRLGWWHFGTLQEPAYERRIWEFMNSLVVDLN